MKAQLPRYTTKDYRVLGFVILPLTLIINSLIFGGSYFTDLKILAFATPVTAIAFSIDFIICGAVAVLMKNRFPRENQVEKRLTIMIILFILITGLFLLSLFKGYELFPFLNYSFNDEGFTWAYIAMGIVNVFLTFLHEGIARYENWKANLRETEALNKVYRQTRLQGLKSQINPHFLFNSLNSLSSLIHEDEKKGEKFLDEMSKVYRYMLHNDEETLVPLETELKFLDSYLHILQARHREGLKLSASITETDKDKWLPPLTLQTIVENAVTCNAICRDCPLEIGISSDGKGHLTIRNNIIPKMTTEPSENTPGLDNLVKKYRLLNQPEVAIEVKNQWRSICLPLIDKKEEAAV